MTARETPVPGKAPADQGTASGRAPWSKGEDALVCRYYPKSGTRELAALLPTRTLAAIRERARFLEVSAPSAGRAITLEQARALLARAEGNATRAARLCKVPVATFHRRLVAFGLTTPRDTGHWPGAELTILRQYYATEGLDLVCRRLPHRTKDAIRKQAERLAAKDAIRKRAKYLATSNASHNRAKRLAANKAIRSQAARRAAKAASD